MKNPYLNALIAAVYIGTLVLSANAVFSLKIEDNIFMPMAALSLFVLSAAIMGFLFVFRPLALYLEGEKQEALVFFGKTVVSFALCVLGYALIIFIA